MAKYFDRNGAINHAPNVTECIVENWIRIPSTLTFADLANIEDADWRLPINPAVFDLYPQAVNLKELLQLVKRDRISPIPAVSLKHSPSLSISSTTPLLHIPC
nr:unnamed protein product [Spirometra erinaceieuropaei]